MTATPAQRLLAGWLGSADPRERILAIRWLAEEPQLGDAGQIPKLAFDDAEPGVRAEAIAAVVAQRGRAARPDYMDLFDGKPSSARGRLVEMGAALVAAGAAVDELPRHLRFSVIEATLAARRGASERARTDSWRKARGPAAFGVGVYLLACLPALVLGREMFLGETRNLYNYFGLSILLSMPAIVATTYLASRRYLRRAHLFSMRKRYRVLLAPSTLFPCGVAAWAIGQAAGTYRLVSVSASRPRAPDAEPDFVTIVAPIATYWGCIAGVLVAVIVATTLAAFSPPRPRGEALLASMSAALSSAILISLSAVSVAGGNARTAIALSLAMAPLAVGQAVALGGLSSSGPSGSRRSAHRRWTLLAGLGFVAAGAIWHLWTPGIVRWHPVARPRESMRVARANELKYLGQSHRTGRERVQWVELELGAVPTFLRMDVNLALVQGTVTMPNDIVEEIQIVDLCGEAAARQGIRCERVSLVRSGRRWHSEIQIRPGERRGANFKVDLYVGSIGAPPLFNVAWDVDWNARNESYSPKRLRGKIVDANLAEKADVSVDSLADTAIAVDLDDERSRSGEIFIEVVTKRIGPPRSPDDYRCKNPDGRCELREPSWE